MSSLRSRITIGVVGITSLVVLVAAVGVWAAAHTFIMRGIDADLAGHIERFRKGPPGGPGGPGPGGPGGQGAPSGQNSATSAAQPAQQGPANPAWRGPREFRGDSRRWFQLYDTANNTELVRSSNIPEGVDLTTRAKVLDVPVTVTLPDGHPLRVIAITLPERHQRAATAIDLEQPLAELQRLELFLASLWLAATLLAWAGVALLRPFLLRPLGELTSAIDRLGPEDLAGRLPEAVGPDEVRGFVARLNSLLSRLEGAFRREQTTIANIAHELRTPVTVLRTALEFRLMAVESKGEETVLRDCFRTVERMQAIVANLLLLAQLEAGRVPLAREPVDLAEMLREQLAHWRKAATARGQHFHATIPDELPLDSAPGHWRQVIDNLLRNAIAHAPDRCNIQVRLTADGLTIENPFIGDLDEAQLGQAFYRADAARSDGDHTGLGLALCKRLLVLLGGRLEVRSNDGIFRVTAHLRST